LTLLFNYKYHEILIFFDSYNQKIKLKYNLHKGCLWWKPELTEKDFPDIAAATQSIYEDFLNLVIKEIKKSL
jgi:hypothetical protein